MRTACNVGVIKTKRFNGMFLLSIAWNISHSSILLWVLSLCVEAQLSAEALRLTKEREVVVKRILGVMGKPRERCLPPNPLAFQEDHFNYTLLYLIQGFF